MLDSNLSLRLTGLATWAQLFHLELFNFVWSGSSLKRTLCFSLPIYLYPTYLQDMDTDSWAAAAAAQPDEVISIIVMPTHSFDGSTLRSRADIKKRLQPFEKQLLESGTTPTAKLVKLVCGGLTPCGQSCSFARPFILLPSKEGLKSFHSDASSVAPNEVNLTTSWTLEFAKQVSDSCKTLRKVAAIPAPTASFREFEKFNHNILGGFVAYHNKCQVYETRNAKRSRNTQESPYARRNSESDS